MKFSLMVFGGPDPKQNSDWHAVASGGEERMAIGYSQQHSCHKQLECSWMAGGISPLLEAGLEHGTRNTGNNSECSHLELYDCRGLPSPLCAFTVPSATGEGVAFPVWSIREERNS